MFQKQPTDVAGALGYYALDREVTGFDAAKPILVFRFRNPYGANRSGSSRPASGGDPDNRGDRVAATAATPAVGWRTGDEEKLEGCIWGEGAKMARRKDRVFSRPNEPRIGLCRLLLVAQFKLQETVVHGATGRGEAGVCSNGGQHRLTSLVKVQSEPRNQ